MSRLIVTHPDGRSYSVTPEVFESVYAPQGFTIEHPETPDDFVAVVPPPRRRPAAKRRGRKGGGA